MGVGGGRGGEVFYLFSGPRHKIIFCLFLLYLCHCTCAHAYVQMLNIHGYSHLGYHVT